MYNPAAENYYKFQEVIELFETNCQQKGIEPKKHIYDDFSKLEQIYKESEDYNHEVQGYLKDFKVFELLHMEDLRI